MNPKKGKSSNFGKQKSGFARFGWWYLHEFLPAVWRHEKQYHKELSNHYMNLSKAKLVEPHITNYLSEIFPKFEETEEKNKSEAKNKIGEIKNNKKKAINPKRKERENLEYSDESNEDDDDEIVEIPHKRMKIDNHPAIPKASSKIAVIPTNSETKNDNKNGNAGENESNVQVLLLLCFVAILCNAIVVIQ